MATLPDWLHQRVKSYEELKRQAGRSAEDTQRDAQARTPNAHRLRSTLQSRAAKVNASTRSIVGIAYPGWDPLPASKGTVTRAEVERFVDSYGTFMRRSTVRSLSQRFMANGRAVDTDHNRVAGAAQIGESFIVQEGDARFPDHAGSWAVAPVITREDVWARVEAGDRGEPTGLNGFSIDVVTAFRDFDVNVEGVGVVTLGEFVDPEPLYLSLVSFPSTGELFQPGQRQTSQSAIQIIRCESASVNRGDTMSETTPATQPEISDEDLGIIARILRTVQRDPTKVQRAVCVQRAVESLLTKVEAMDLRKEAYGLADMLWSYIYDVMNDAELDSEGKRQALVQGFTDLAKLAKERLSEDVVTQVSRNLGGAEDLATVTARLAATTQRAGKKISKARLDKLQNALALLQEVLSDASDTEGDAVEVQEKISEAKENATRGGVVPGNTPPKSETRDGRTEPTHQETTVDEKQAAEILEAVRNITTKVDGLVTEVTTLKTQREAAPADDAETEVAPDPVEQIRAMVEGLAQKVDAVSADVTQLRGVSTQRRGAAGDTTEGMIQRDADRTIITRANGQKVDMTGIL